MSKELQPLSIGKFTGSRGLLADRIALPLVGLIAPDSRLLAMQQVGQGIDIRHIRSRRQDRVDQLGLAVHADLRLHPEVPFLAFRGLVHPRIALAVLVLGRGWRIDDRRIHDRAVGDADAVLPQILVDRRQQLLAQLVAFQEFP